MNAIQFAIAKVNLQLAEQGKPIFLEGVRDGGVVVSAVPKQREPFKGLQSSGHILTGSPVCSPLAQEGGLGTGVKPAPSLEAAQARLKAARTLREKNQARESNMVAAALATINRPSEACGGSLAQQQYEDREFRDAARAGAELRALRRAEIARCEAEIRRLEELPPDIPDRAYLVTMGHQDWRAEKLLLEYGEIA